jgi:ATP-dependent DNA helicase RecG
MRSAAELLDELNAVDESTRIEAKRSSDIGKSMMQTVIAFANEPGLEGGYLLLGVEWHVNDKGDTVYRAAGLPDPDKVQRDLASQCASMPNVPLRPEMKLETVDGCTVLVVFVPEADVTQKPVYLKATGLPLGAYRRIGSTDQRCVDEDLWVLRGESQPARGPDLGVLPDARLDDFDPAAIAAYRRERARVNPQAEELGYGDEDMLEALGMLVAWTGSSSPRWPASCCSASRWRCGGCCPWCVSTTSACRATNGWKTRRTASSPSTSASRCCWHCRRPRPASSTSCPAVSGCPKGRCKASRSRSCRAR